MNYLLINQERVYKKDPATPVLLISSARVLHNNTVCGKQCKLLVTVQG